MNSYTIPFTQLYINCSITKEKEFLKFKHIFNGLQISKLFSFVSYANISFSEEDTKHENAIITELPQFGRNKTNALVYRISPGTINGDLYDKCIFYQYIGSLENYYGFILYNSETQKSHHVYNINYELMYLFIRLKQSINSFNNDKFAKYRKCYK